jgi:hypothetical protein
MNSTDLIAIIEGIGMLAVIVSVLYIAREVRQNNLIAKGESERQMFDSFNEIMHRYSDYESIELVQRALADFAGLSKLEQARFNIIYLLPHLNNLDSFWTHHKLGLIDDDRYQAALFVVLAQLKTPGGQQAWKDIRKAYRKEFSNMIEDSLQEFQKIPPITELLDWLQFNPESDAALLNTFSINQSD